MRERDLTRTHAPEAASEAAAPRISNVFLRGEVVEGNFEVISLLGKGGMAEVYEAHDRALDRLVALKATQGTGSAWLRREAKAMAAIRHPCVPAVYAAGTHRGVDYLVMERIHGLTLAAHLEALGTTSTVFTVEECIDLLVALTEGLVAIHAAGMIHADIKPENVMLAPGQRVVLLDFGIFRHRDTEHDDGTIAGSPAYMAPETIGGRVRSSSSHQVDLYSLGVVAFEMLAGRRPFLGPTFSEVLQQHLDAPVPDLAELRNELTPTLVDLVRRLLEKDPAARPSLAESVWWELRAIRTEMVGAERKGPLSIFIVDDDRNSAAFLRVCARGAARDAHIQLFSCAEQALDAVRREQPDVMLVDLRMPGMSGLELCLYLRGTHLADSCRIICLSGSVPESEVDLLRQLGIPQFVRKGPDLPEQLAGLLAPLRASRVSRKSERAGP